MDLECEYLVVGSGIAGLSFALDVADAGRVIVITKRDADESNTRYAQGGIAAVLDPGDSFEAHVEDTLEAGAGLCHRDAVEVCVREGPERIGALLVPLLASPDSKLSKYHPYRPFRLAGSRPP